MKKCIANDRSTFGVDESIRQAHILKGKTKKRENPGSQTSEQTMKKLSSKMDIPVKQTNLRDQYRKKQAQGSSSDGSNFSLVDIEDVVGVRTAQDSAESQGYSRQRANYEEDQQDIS